MAVTEMLDISRIIPDIILDISKYNLNFILFHFQYNKKNKNNINETK